MNLDELKKASEIFNNIAQPIATLIAAYIGSRIVKSKNHHSVFRYYFDFV